MCSEEAPPRSSTGCLKAHFSRDISPGGLQLFKSLRRKGTICFTSSLKWDLREGAAGWGAGGLAGSRGDSEVGCVSGEAGRLFGA